MPLLSCVLGIKVLRYAAFGDVDIIVLQAEFVCEIFMALLKKAMYWEDNPRLNKGDGCYIFKMLSFPFIREDLMALVSLTAIRAVTFNYFDYNIQ